MKRDLAGASSLTKYVATLALRFEHSEQLRQPLRAKSNMSDTHDRSTMESVC
jgi:hypothetical protein